MKKSIIYLFFGVLAGAIGWLIYKKNKKVTAPSTTALKNPSRATDEEVKASLQLIKDYEANLKNAPTDAEKSKLIAEQEAYIKQLKALITNAPAPTPGPSYTPPNYTPGYNPVDEQPPYESPVYIPLHER
jgi:hypothetical protein